eukprot:COSAG02_NODE_4983_length_4751_cov_2.163371_3_plen_66_part_00
MPLLKLLEVALGQRKSLRVPAQHLAPVPAHQAALRAPASADMQPCTPGGTDHAHPQNDRHIGNSS